MTVAKAKEEWNNFKSRWNDMTMGYTKFFFKSLIELLISAMGLTARKTNTRTHEGKLLCQFCAISLQKQAILGDIPQYGRIL